MHLISTLQRLLMLDANVSYTYLITIYQKLAQSFYIMCSHKYCGGDLQSSTKTEGQKSQPTHVNDQSANVKDNNQLQLFI